MPTCLHHFYSTHCFYFGSAIQPGGANSKQLLTKAYLVKYVWTVPQLDLVSNLSVSSRLHTYLKIIVEMFPLEAFISPALFSMGHEDALFHKLIIAAHQRDILLCSLWNCEIPIMLGSYFWSVL